MYFLRGKIKEMDETDFKDKRRRCQRKGKKS
jgi:hypothetical protein